MRKRYPDRSYVLETEQDARCATRSRFGESDWRFGVVIDELLKQAHFEGPLEPVTASFGAVQSYAGYQFRQGTSTLFMIYRLWQVAYYQEALTLCRHLLEVLVQIRFFLRHAERLAGHLDGNRPQFREMFEDLSPGSYEALYRGLSAIAHGSGSLGFRGERVTFPDEPARIAFRPIQGARFESVWAGFTYTLLISVTLGLLNVHGLLFPKNTVSTDPELSQDLQETRSWLRRLFDEGRARSGTTELFDRMSGLIDV